MTVLRGTFGGSMFQTTTTKFGRAKIPFQSRRENRFKEAGLAASFNDSSVIVFARDSAFTKLEVTNQKRVRLN
jgi:hypothetical protein